MTRLLLDTMEVTPFSVSKPFLSFGLGVAVLQQGSSKGGRAKVRTGTRRSCYHPGLGREGSASLARSCLVALWGESQGTRQAQGRGVIQLQESPLHCLCHMAGAGTGHRSVPCPAGTRCGKQQTRGQSSVLGLQGAPGPGSSHVNPRPTPDHS